MGRRHAFRMIGIGVRVTVVLLFLTLAAATLESYRSPVAVGLTWRDVHALKFQHGAIQYWYGPNRQVLHRALPDNGLWQPPWQIAVEELANEDAPDQLFPLPAYKPLATVRRANIALHIWPPFNAVGGLQSSRTMVADTAGKPTILRSAWFRVRAASAWLLVGALAPPTVLILVRSLRRLRRKPGHCPACGYDLRATPHRCPECGTTLLTWEGAR